MQGDFASEEFEKLWKVFEGKGAKSKAKEYWLRLSEEDRAAIATKAPAYVASTSGERLVYRKNLEGWINPSERRWEAPIAPQSTNVKKVYGREEAEAERLAIRLKNGRDPVWGGVDDQDKSRDLLIYEGKIKP